MANEISKVNDFIINNFSSDPLVNTLSIVPTVEMDANKENIYPLVNIDMTDSEVEDQVLVVYFIMTIVQQRDLKPVKTDSKLLLNDNYLDNINETTSIAQRLINILTRQNNSELITIDSLSKLKVLKNWGGGGLDGVQFTIQLAIPNEGQSCEVIESLYNYLDYAARVATDNGVIEDPVKAEADFNTMLGSELLFMTPTSRKLNKLYSMLPDDGLGDYTVATQSTKLVTDENGLLVEVPAGLPAFTYENGYSQLKKEGQSTNLLKHSSDFTQWPLIGSSTILTGGVQSPTGDLNAFRLDMPAVGATFLAQAATSNNIVCFSVYVKSAGTGNDKFTLFMAGNSLKKTYTATDEWVRYDFIGLHDSGNVGISNDLDIFATDIFIFSAQIEESDKVSSIIPTNATTVTRLADDISVTTPAGVTQITETINGVDNVITTIPTTHQISEGLIDKVKMI